MFMGPAPWALQLFHPFGESARVCRNSISNFTAEEGGIKDFLTPPSHSSMHFSTLALFIITLPAAAYAAAYSEQFPVGPKYDCLLPGELCDFTTPCCAGLICEGVGRFENVSDSCR
jgi:hypothetical protein